MIARSQACPAPASRLAWQRGAFHMTTVHGPSGSKLTSFGPFQQTGALSD